MPKLVFYHQVRVDGGRRTGICIDDDNDSLHHFEPGPGSDDDFDPTLAWYVDVRIEGERLPTEPRNVLAWFSENESCWIDALLTAASELELGMDAGIWPYHRQVTEVPAGVRCTLFVHAGKRRIGREIAMHLRALAGRGRSLMEPLTALALT